MPPLDAAKRDPEPMEYVAEPACASPLDAGRSEFRVRPVSAEELDDLRRENIKLETIRRHLQKDIVIKDAYLAHLRADLRAKNHEVVALREAMTTLHCSIAQTLHQPRYRAVDALNAGLHQIPFLHGILKRWLTARKISPSSQ